MAPNLPLASPGGGAGSAPAPSAPRHGSCKRLGYRILARNYTCPLGELDLVALDGGCIVFVEVRSTGTDDADRPAASVDAAKQRRLTNLALHFLQQAPPPEPAGPLRRAGH